MYSLSGWETAGLCEAAGSLHPHWKRHGQRHRELLPDSGHPATIDPTAHLGAWEHGGIVGAQYLSHCTDLSGRAAGDLERRYQKSRLRTPEYALPG